MADFILPFSHVDAAAAPESGADVDEHALDRLLVLHAWHTRRCMVKMM
jgi:hypothetical protein